MPHKYRVGQKVRLTGGSRYQTSAAAPYAVVRQLPVEHSEEPRYRVKALGEPYDRVARESELEAS